MNKQRLKEYWKRNLMYLVILLTIWFLVSYVLGILLVEPMNSIRIGGFKTGFLVCTTRFYLHICHTDIRLCTADE